jgi:hypothetical protein
LPSSPLCWPASAQEAPRGAYLLKPDAVFDGTGTEPHRGWQVLVRGNRIEAVGPPSPPWPTRG